jgi:hypothetical protein
VRRLAQRLRLARDQAEDLATQIRQHARAHFSLLTGLCGVSLLTAGARAGLLGPGRRFRTDAQLAASAGVAPLEASSAGRVRHRLNRGGNRRCNAILHRIAIVQAQSSPAARAYLARRVSEGKTRREAIRALKRFLVRAIWRLWQECARGPCLPCQPQPGPASAGPRPDPLTLDNRGAAIPSHRSRLRAVSPDPTRCGSGRWRYLGRSHGQGQLLGRWRVGQPVARGHRPASAG